MNWVPLYIGAIGLAMLASALWRWKQGDPFGMVASLIMAGMAAWALAL